MDEEKRALLKSKLEAAANERSRQRLEAEKARIAENVEGFAGKYRFADESEREKLRGFMEKLHFTSPAKISAAPLSAPAPHGNMYLCFLAGSEELLDISIYGHHDDLMADMDEWEIFSHSLLLVEEDLSRYICIDDNREITEAAL